MSGNASGDAYCKNLGVAKIERYVQRGRYLESEDTVELQNRWLRTLAALRRNVETRAALGAADEIDEIDAALRANVAIETVQQ